MKYCIAFLVLVVAALTCRAQTFLLKGIVLDDQARPLKGIAVSLLQPADSTLAFFGISDAHGYYEIRANGSGNYLLQAAGFGYQSHYDPVAIPLTTGTSLPGITLKSSGGMQLDNVTVVAEKVPILFKKDTIEYNAGSFKTKPDAVTEDLLRKMPGIEVDKAGNIKAHGKDVQKVLVDGKDFFGDDPKVATKNLPADAVDKVQVYDALSDAAQFTGIDDGNRDKTINLKLKSNKRRGYFGDVEGGAGTDERYRLHAKIYRFQQKSQFAVLGMLNNINQFGFSLQDYLSFKGGLQGLMDGGGQQPGDHLPISFGQETPGLITSGAAGVNYTLEPRAGSRYNISYLGNGAERKLEQESDSRNFTPTETYLRNESSDENNRDLNHRLSINLRHEPDSINQLRLKANAIFNHSRTDRSLLSSSAVRDIVLNRLDSRLYNDADGTSADATLGWLRRQEGAWPVLNVSFSGGVDAGQSKLNWNNLTFYPATAIIDVDNAFQHNNRQKYRYSAAGTLTRALGHSNYLDPELRGGFDHDQLTRIQGLAGQGETPVDSLSLRFAQQYSWLRPGLNFRHSIKAFQYNIALRAEEGLLKAQSSEGRSWLCLLPAASWQYTPGGGTMANLSYSTAVAAPGAQQMLPLTDYSSSVQRIHGNPLLRPEYHHTVFAGWNRFNQFSFTSMSASLQGSITKDRISFSRYINPDLTEDIFYTNTPADYNLVARGSYSTPIRRLGVNFSGSINEQYNRTNSLVNDVLNVATSITHAAKLGLSNRKQDKWSAELSVAADLTDARYSVQESLNNTFVHYNATCSLSHRPSDHFYYGISADVDRYDSRSFGAAVTIPLLKASASWYFLKARRGVLGIEGFDLLDQNKGLRRISQLNYLLEQRSNIIGRYFLLSFKYRLSHAGNSGVKVKVGS